MKAIIASVVALALIPTLSHAAPRKVEKSIGTCTRYTYAELPTKLTFPKGATVSFGPTVDNGKLRYSQKALRERANAPYKTMSPKGWPGRKTNGIFVCVS